jgi:hypothetical protein
VLKGIWKADNPRVRGLADKLDYIVTWVGSN